MARLRRTPRTLLLLLAAVLVLGAAGGGYLWWRHDDSFCTRVGQLPDAMSSVASSGSPAAGLLDSAAKLDGLASVAPDAATASAARDLATAQRALGEALGSGSGTTTVVSAVGGVATAQAAQVAAARTTLDAAISSSCR